MTFDGTEGKAPLMGSSSSSSTGTAQGGRVQHYQGKMTIYVLVGAARARCGGLGAAV